MAKIERQISYLLERKEYSCCELKKSFSNEAIETVAAFSNIKGSVKNKLGI